MAPIEATRPLLSERLRPRALDDLTLPARDIARLRHMLTSRDVMNMLFHGAPGTGKTSAARIFGAELGRLRFREVNGSSSAGLAFLRQHLVAYASHPSFQGEPKVVFIDEADFIPTRDQVTLRKTIEDYHRTCRFIVAVNEMARVPAAIQSRLVPICFDVTANQRDIKRRLVARYGQVLRDDGIAYNVNALQEIVGRHFPDLRAIANQVEYRFK